MYKKLSDAKLKTGEDLEVGLIIAPDEENAEGVAKVLHHKGEVWLSHVNRALSGDIKELETRFYVGKLDGQIVANVMTTEYNRTGILGHVFTIPEQRRKGICSFIMEQLMADFKRRGGGVLILGTGFNSHPYWIYHSFGFRSIIENTGYMRFSTEDDFEQKYFMLSNAKTVDVQWKHWSVINILMSVQEAELVKSISAGRYGRLNFEGGFLVFINQIEEGKLNAKLLESESGAVVGCITLEQDRRWAGKTYILDMFMHKNFFSHYDTLLKSIELPEGKIQCFIDTNAPKEKINALEKSGFENEALLKKQFVWDSEAHDVAVYSKFN